MKVIGVKDYQELSKTAAEYVIQKIQSTSKITLGLPTGGTPTGMYANLIDDHKLNGTSYKGVTSFNLDEYIGLSRDNPNSYCYYMNDILYNHIDINKSKTHIPHGDEQDLRKECLSYERLIEENGGIDLQILGIGKNGHIGFNEPKSSFESTTHVVQLAPSTISANARFFDRLEEVPTTAITMGIATIMKSKEILLLVSGEEKSEALKRLLYGEINKNFPASVLNNHPNVTIIADAAAVSDVKIHS